MSSGVTVIDVAHHDLRDGPVLHEDLSELRDRRGLERRVADVRARHEADQLAVLHDRELMDPVLHQGVAGEFQGVSRRDRDHVLCHPLADEHHWLLP